MVLVIALVLVFFSAASDSVVQGAPNTYSGQNSVVSKFSERRSLVFEDECDGGYFHFNIKSQLIFIANRTTTTRSEAENELQCQNCHSSGVPAYINCTNSNTDRLKSAEWTCEGPFPNEGYKVTSSEINCEYDDVFRRHCVKMGSCVLTFSAGVAPHADWLLIVFLAQIALILIGVAVYKSRNRVKSMLTKRSSRYSSEFYIDVVEARRRGREEIKRLRAERDVRSTNRTTTMTTTAASVASPKSGSAAEEACAMTAITSACLE